MHSARRIGQTTGVLQIKGVRDAMANLTTKELAGLSDQLEFERVVCCKYQAAAQESTDAELKTCFQQCADQHKQNYTCLLNYLK